MGLHLHLAEGPCPDSPPCTRTPWPTALSKKVKGLMALGIGIAARCGSCIAYHTHDALKAGATRQQILETIGVAIFMGGGPAMVYGCEALAALDEAEFLFHSPGRRRRG
jgi:AhpD family alkylhydroperoxidase